MGSIPVSLETVYPQLREVWSRFNVTRAWLFGSRALANITPGSDWDFLVEFSQPPTFDTFMGLKSSLEQRLQGSVDLLSRPACTPRFLKAVESQLIDVT
jgi:predicted nucleotidyltransferase